MSGQPADIGSRPVAAYERDPVFYYRVIFWLGVTAVGSVAGAVLNHVVWRLECTGIGVDPCRDGRHWRHGGRVQVEADSPVPAMASDDRSRPVQPVSGMGS